jgi:hypothetical protein
MNPIEEIKPGLYIQQTKTGWRVVKPIQKDISRPFSFKNNINWKHFLIGDWSRLITFIVIMILILFAAWAYNHDLKACADKYANECMQAKVNPCFSACWKQCGMQVNNLLDTDPIINFTKNYNGT